jgi:hypothetical protein
VAKKAKKKQTSPTDKTTEQLVYAAMAEAVRSNKTLPVAMQISDALAAASSTLSEMVKEMGVSEQTAPFFSKLLESLRDATVALSALTCVVEQDLRAATLDRVLDASSTPRPAT